LIENELEQYNLENTIACNSEGKLAYDRQNEWFVLLPLAKKFRFFFPYKDKCEVRKAIKILIFG